MTVWISSGEEGDLVRAKLNELHDYVYNMIDGTSGSSGRDSTSGTSGRPGTSGINGSSGTSAYGSSGKDGTAGSSGKNGDTYGTSGTSGVDGIFYGTSGSSGVDGTFYGSSGKSGSSGTSGTSGSSGRGTSGTDGTAGTSGKTGSSGSSGKDGIFYGTSGSSGTNGPSGPSGSSGKDGNSGSSGSSGNSIISPMFRYQWSSTYTDNGACYFDGSYLYINRYSYDGADLAGIWNNVKQNDIIQIVLSQGTTYTVLYVGSNMTLISNYYKSSYSQYVGGSFTEGDPVSLLWISVGYWSPVPSSSGSVGEAGNMAYDSNYLYVCVNNNSWLRFSGSTF